ncbi:MAG: YceI family protein [Bacteroidia bacterium]|nr:YceI family protein [Winogradskyella sp.]MBT8376214.1 YceI family protein [Bacteroidia bacterium]NNL82048.1 YceI family protein [Winogradskyella sp.]
MPNNRLHRLFLLVVLVYVPITAQTIYTVDQELSEVTFKVTHLGLLTVDGKFTEFEGQITIEEGELTALQSDVNVNSVFTDNEERDSILKGDTYFDAAQFPNISFKATNVERNVAGEQIVVGLMTIKDVERIIQFPITLEFVKKNTGLIFKAEPTISRSDFNLEFGSMNSLVGDKVRIKLLIYAFK